MPEIPPWMNINPLQAVPFFLQGYGQGAQTGEAQRRAEQVSYEQSLQEAAQQERNALLREAKQIQAQEFAATLQLKQEQARQAAAEATIQLEGRQGLEKGMAARIAQGMSAPEAFRQELPLWAPKLLYKHPPALADVMRELQPAKNVIPQTTTLAGQQVIYNPAGGGFKVIEQTPQTGASVNAIPILDESGNTIAFGRPGAHGEVIPLPRGESTTKTMRSLRKEKRELEKAKQNAALLGTDTSSIDADLAAVQAEMDQLATGTKATPAQAKGALVKVSSKEEYDKLPSGADYIAPDGSIRHKK
jgi:hypothetical protein